MEPTLRSGDRLLVAGGRRPGPGDIVALRDPRREGRRLIVKRVVSVDGDRVVVEGDNASASTDSRVFGPVDRRALVGRVLYRYFPPERAGAVGSERRSWRRPVRSGVAGPPARGTGGGSGGGESRRGRGVGSRGSAVPSGP